MVTDCNSIHNRTRTHRNPSILMLSFRRHICMHTYLNAFPTFSDQGPKCWTSAVVLGSYARLFMSLRRQVVRTQQSSALSTSRIWPSPPMTTCADHMATRCRLAASRLRVVMAGKATLLRHLTMQFMSVQAPNRFQKNC